MLSTKQDSLLALVCHIHLLLKWRDHTQIFVLLL